MESVIAFANTDSGGLVLLGVDEGNGTFDVVGVDDPKAVHDTFTAQCSQLEPPLRVAVYLISHPDGVVISARIPSVGRTQRPCHRGDPYESSYIRVGDRDDRMTRQEVDDLLANRVGNDYSAGPAPADARLDPALSAQLATAVRARSERNANLTDEEALAKYRALTDEGEPTLAGLLALGDNPEALTATARVSYQVAPQADDQEGTRFREAKHLEGTVGQILDDALAELRKQLRVSKVTGPDGHVYDRPEVATEALREVLGNALIHRSLAPGQTSASARLEVHEDHVLITSPGGIHIDVDPRDLGHRATLNTPRNLSLARICEQLTTPSGARITEGQASGIRAADRASHAANTAPPIFGSRPARFSVVLFRGSLDSAAARARWADSGVALTDEQARIVAFAERLEDFLEQDPSSDFSQVRLDAKLTARLFERMEPERAVLELAALENAGVLTGRRLFDRVVWELKPPTSTTSLTVPEPAEKPAASTAAPAKGRAPNRSAQIAAVLDAIEGSAKKAIRLSDAIDVLGVSRGTAHKVLVQAVDNGLIEPTTDVIHSPARAYKLTRKGAATQQRPRR